MYSPRSVHLQNRDHKRQHIISEYMPISMERTSGLLVEAVKHSYTHHYSTSMKYMAMNTCTFEREMRLLQQYRRFAILVTILLFCSGMARSHTVIAHQQPKRYLRL